MPQCKGRLQTASKDDRQVFISTPLHPDLFAPASPATAAPTAQSPSLVLGLQLLQKVLGDPESPGADAIPGPGLTDNCIDHEVA